MPPAAGTDDEQAWLPFCPVRHRAGGRGGAARAYTRLTHAGLGCPDWPGCYGFIGVPMSEQQTDSGRARFPEAPVEVAKGWYEMIHRYLPAPWAW